MLFPDSHAVLPGENARAGLSGKAGFGKAGKEGWTGGRRRVGGVGEKREETAGKEEEEEGKKW